MCHEMASKKLFGIRVRKANVARVFVNGMHYWLKWHGQNEKEKEKNTHRENVKWKTKKKTHKQEREIAKKIVCREALAAFGKQLERQWVDRIRCFSYGRILSHAMRIDEICETIVNANMYRLPTEHVVRTWCNIRPSDVYTSRRLFECMLLFFFSLLLSPLFAVYEKFYWIAHSFCALELPARCFFLVFIVFEKFIQAPLGKRLFSTLPKTARELERFESV